jgi:hypothetical protein
VSLRGASDALDLLTPEQVLAELADLKPVYAAARLR